MKQFLLVLLVILWPATARATLFTYDISVMMLAEYLADPRFGDVAIAVSFPQETTLSYPYNNFQLSSFTDLRPLFSVDGDNLNGSMFWSLSQVSLTGLPVLDWRCSGEYVTSICFTITVRRLTRLSGNLIASWSTLATNYLRRAWAGATRRQQARVQSAPGACIRLIRGSSALSAVRLIRWLNLPPWCC